MITSKYAPTEEELEFAKASMPVIQQKKSTTSKSKYAATEEELEFAGGALSEPEREEIPWYKSLPNAFIQGLNEGIIGLGGGVQGEVNRVLHTEKLAQENEEIKKVVEENYPSEEGAVESYTKRFGKILPAALQGNPVQGIVRTGVAAALGEGAKKLGFGEGVQTIAELVGFASPNPTKIIQARNQAQGNLINFGRRMGMTEKQIAPVIHPEGKWNRFLTSTATRRGRTANALTESQEALGTIYDHLRESPGARTNLTKQQTNDFFYNISEQFENLPENLRNEVLTDFRELASKQITGETLINFHQDVNDTIQRIGGHRGRRLGGVQHSIMDAITSGSPELAMDLALTDQLYANYGKMRTALQPTVASDLLSGAKAIGAVVSLITGNYPHLAGLGYIAAGRKLASELLVNPRLQNLQHKMLRALNENKITIANELLGQFREEIKENVPEFYEELEGEKFPSTIHRKEDK